jgi:hypothetical protein
MTEQDRTMRIDALGSKSDFVARKFAGKRVISNGRMRGGAPGHPMALTEN